MDAGAIIANAVDEAFGPARYLQHCFPDSIQARPLPFPPEFLVAGPRFCNPCDHGQAHVAECRRAASSRPWRELSGRCHGTD
jgi:hypothetical protein